MPRPRPLALALPLLVFFAGLVAGARAEDEALPAAESRARVLYPQDGSVFPPEIVPPTWIWSDATPGVEAWRIDIRGDAEGEPQPFLEVVVPGVPPAIGEIDPAAIAPTNELPAPPPPDHRSWTPDEATWSSLKAHTKERWATATITGFARAEPTRPLSQASFTFQTCADPVGAPIFYRDVPLAPAVTTAGQIRPLDEGVVPIIQWRLRDIGRPASRVVLEHMPTCANCHSFSRDGKALGMDIDGPQGDKGVYAIADLAPRTTIDYDDLVTWNDFPGKPEGHTTIGFLSRISPDGRRAVTTVNEALFVTNFADYRFLQVFYPTRGILAWTEKGSGTMQALPGADDVAFVHCDPVWTPDGRDIVFCRAPAKDPYEPGRPLPTHPNDPNETPIQYDLYRVPFADGQGGTARPIPGAADNGWSNTFPKVSPDGKWIVYVRCRNGQLMRPDGKLMIVPAEGGTPRLMRCNTETMNSWHSWSPNSRWMVFSSKQDSPYTRMYLTHIDEEGNDTPPILVPNATASNRAVNLPEFVNVPYEEFQAIEVPAVEHWRRLQTGYEAMREDRLEAALAAFDEAIAILPDHAPSHVYRGWALKRLARAEEAAEAFMEALRLNPAEARAHVHLGELALGARKPDLAVSHFRLALERDRDDADAWKGLGRALLASDQLDAAAEAYGQALERSPDDLELHRQAGRVHMRRADPAAALPHLERVVLEDPEDLGVTNALAWHRAACPRDDVRDEERALELARGVVARSPTPNASYLDTLAVAQAASGLFDEAIETTRQALDLLDSKQKGGGAQAGELRARLALYRERKPYRYVLPPR